VAGFEDGGVAGADEGRGGVGGEQAQHGDGEGFVGVEVAAEDMLGYVFGGDTREFGTCECQ
jgi:hypothetical protein